ncbi:CRISPR-associated protein, Csh2 family [Methanococcus maripaludis C5]|uniref:CRISPR-associated protein, Csh2 family n=1 Tax=Methanococcus maripaludis (strain C5 / ATCC BAA-1333) TaxID=402880 RepID=A4FXZ6_METM5|nr:type I-B CRISPR-associated protein Cas7/Csh2 [Methanococcus maripaludis]ABO35080.1 CRISPR-associated protein, Csh2 family [Methanococcus maripaludis C5]
MSNKDVSNIITNSEILFIYDAEKTNPNGDMDNQNKPRMDWDTNTNLVSDVRLKRYIRDYFEKYLGEEIFITENAKDSKDRAKQLDSNKKQHTDLIDVRLFGAVFAEEGSNSHISGPVQFNWGYSLNEVELQESTTITSSFSSGTGVGKDYRVKYSVIAFNGAINGNAAKTSTLSEKDIVLLDEAILNSIPLCRTRSKIGQTPRLYIRVCLKDEKSYLDDLREYISLKNKKNLNNVLDVELNISNLIGYLKKNTEKISEIICWKHENLSVPEFETLTDENTYNKNVKITKLVI